MTIFAIETRGSSLNSVHTCVVKASETLTKLEEEQEGQKYATKYTLEVYNVEDLINRCNKYENILRTCATTLLNTSSDY